MTMLSSTPRSRRERPAKPALTRAGIIATAVALMQAESLERVTMRRLSQELDTGPASLYVYIRSTAELHAAVLDELLGAIDLSPAKARGEWRERLLQILLSYTVVLFEQPGLAQSALVVRPSGTHALDLAEALLSLLAEGGISNDRSAWASDLLLQFATATAAEQATRDRSLDTEDEHDALRRAIQDASAKTYPHIAELGDELLSGTGMERLTWGFHVLINGTLNTPRSETELSGFSRTEPAEDST